MQGHAVFAERLGRFAAAVDAPLVSAIARSAAAEVTVAVLGRRGVGRGTVARALASAGMSVDEDGDIAVYVVAEVVKPEDEAAIKASARPALVVLNKADLIARPGMLCERYRGLTGALTVPMVAHLAVATVDDAMMSALRTSAATEEPSSDTRVLEALDMSGVAVAVRALRAGADAAAVQRVLRRRSGVDGVVAALTPMIARIGYHRVRTAVGSLEALAATVDDDLAGRITGFLSDDDTALACMAAAVDVVEASGMSVDRGDDAAAHLRRATQWHQVRRSPVDAVHARCADDIVRGSLRLWRRTDA